MTELLPMATHVQYHHRAAVARIKKLYDDHNSPSGWKLLEGCTAGESVPWETDIFARKGFTFGIEETHYDPGADLKSYFFNVKLTANEKFQRINKTVMVWPEEGSGWIIGHVRRSIGNSWRASGGHGSMFDDSYEPGGHATYMYVNLYVVKRQLAGTNYILCPTWAVLEV